MLTESTVKVIGASSTEMGLPAAAGVLKSLGAVLGDIPRSLQAPFDCQFPYEVSIIRAEDDEIIGKLQGGYKDLVLLSTTIALARGGS